jgi:hypothetical protein
LEFTFNKVKNLGTSPNFEISALAQLESAMEEGGIEAMLDVARQFGIPTNIDQ